MKAQIDLIGIITPQIKVMAKFYTEVLGFSTILEMDEYIEFKHEGVRFALSTSEVMHMATGDEEYLKPQSGHSLELAFKVDTPEEVDTTFAELVKKGAKAVKEPKDQVWNQRTAFFADPDGHIHEVFADLPKA
jgi:lactoylglutathione lyase